MKTINEGFKTISEREALALFTNMCLGPVGLTMGNTSQNVGFGYAPRIIADGGYTYSIAQVNSGITSGLTVASGKCALFAVWVNSAGSVGCVMGSAVSASLTCYLPSQIATSRTVVGLFKVSMASTVSFTTGTNGLGSASVTSCTVQYWDVALIPQGVILQAQ